MWGRASKKSVQKIWVEQLGLGQGGLNRKAKKQAKTKTTPRTEENRGEGTEQNRGENRGEPSGTEENRGRNRGEPSGTEENRGEPRRTEENRAELSRIKPGFQGCMALVQSLLPQILPQTMLRSRLVALVCVFTNSLFRFWFFLGEKNKILFFEKFLMLDFICIFKSAA